MHSAATWSLLRRSRLKIVCPFRVLHRHYAMAPTGALFQEPCPLGTRSTRGPNSLRFGLVIQTMAWAPKPGLCRGSWIGSGFEPTV